MAFTISVRRQRKICIAVSIKPKEPWPRKGNDEISWPILGHIAMVSFPELTKVKVCSLSSSSDLVWNDLPSAQLSNKPDSKFLQLTYPLIVRTKFIFDFRFPAGRAWIAFTSARTSSTSARIILIWHTATRILIPIILTSTYYAFTTTFSLQKIS